METTIHLTLRRQEWKTGLTRNCDTNPKEAINTDRKRGKETFQKGK